MKKIDLFILFLSLIVSICCQESVQAKTTIKDTLTLEYFVSGIKESTITENVNKVLNAAQQDINLNSTEINDFYFHAPENIKRAIQPYGYFNSKIKSRLEHKKNTWKTYFDVTLGKRIPIDKIDIQILGEGKDDPLFKTFLNNFPLKTKQVFTTDTYQKAKQDLIILANNNGYPNAQFSTQVVEIDIRNYIANIILYLNTGPRLYFGPINVTPNFFANDFLKRYAPFHQGQVYSAQKILDYNQNLNNSNYFQQVVLTPKLSDITDHNVPIELTVTPVKTFLYSIGTGYGTDTGIRGALGFNWHRVNRYGHYFTSNLLISQIGSNFTNSYYIPGSNPTADLYNVTINFNNTSTAAGESNSQRVSAGFSKKRDRWRQIYDLTFLKEKYQLTGQTNNHSQLLMPGVNYYYVNTDNITKPRYGFSWKINLRGALEEALSGTNFLQIEINDAWIQPLILRQNRLVFRTDIGTTINKHFNQLPLSIRFFAGGAESVRGYNFQSLGPGQYLFTASSELQQRIYNDIYIGVFYDIGNAFNDFKHPMLRESVGLALIWQSPVGNIELSLARTIGEPKKSWAIQFSIGSLL